MKRKHAFAIISEGLTTELSRDANSKVFSKENTKESTSSPSSPNLVALQQELQKIQIKPKYIKINLKK